MVFIEKKTIINKLDNIFVLSWSPNWGKKLVYDLLFIFFDHNYVVAISGRDKLKCSKLNTNCIGPLLN